MTEFINDALAELGPFNFDIDEFLDQIENGATTFYLADLQVLAIEIKTLQAQFQLAKSGLKELSKLMERPYDYALHILRQIKEMEKP